MLESRNDNHKGHQGHKVAEFVRIPRWAALVMGHVCYALTGYSLRLGQAEFSRILLRVESRRDPGSFLIGKSSGIRENSAVGSAGHGSAVLCLTGYSLRLEQAEFSRILLRVESRKEPGSLLMGKSSGIRENSAVGSAGHGSRVLCLAGYSLRLGLAEFSRILLRVESRRDPGSLLMGKSSGIRENSAVGSAGHG